MSKKLRGLGVIAVMVMIVLAIGSQAHADKEGPPLPVPVPAPSPPETAVVDEADVEPVVGALMPKQYRLPSIEDFYRLSKLPGAQPLSGYIAPMDVRCDEEGHAYLRADAVIVSDAMIKRDAPLIAVRCVRGVFALDVSRVSGRYFWGGRQKKFEAGEHPVKSIEG